MLKKVASTKLLSGLFVAGGILGMNQAAKAGNVVNSEVIKPVISYSRSYADCLRWFESTYRYGTQ